MTYVRWASVFAGALGAVIGMQINIAAQPKPSNCSPIAISATTPDGQTSTRRGLRCDLYED